MSNMLVVGKNGGIGSALFAHLQAIHPNTFATSHKPSHDDHTFYLNLADDPNTWDFKQQHFDVAYLCAGICRMNLCEENKADTYQVNVTGMSALIDKLNQQGTFIVFLSTNQVFSGDKAHEKTNASYQPNNEYGRQKVATERYLQEHAKNYAIVRLTKVVEPNMALITNWLTQLNQATALNAFHDMPLAPVSLKQVVQQLVLIGAEKKTGIYHMSGEKDVSYFELASYLANCIKCDPSLVKSISALDVNIPKNFLPRFTSLDCSSTIALGGFKPPSIEEVLEECFPSLRGALFSDEANQAVT